MTPTALIRSAGRTERGRRARNEDRFLCREIDGVGIYAVADGLGGVAGGQVAANRAVQLLSERLVDVAAAARGGDASGLLETILVEIDADLKRFGEADPVLTGLGTTFTLAALAPGRVAFAHAGDSRLWLAGAGLPFRRLTEDMNLAARLLREGRIGEAEFAASPHRARLLAYLGKGSVRPQRGSIALPSSAAIALATDGLTGPLAEDEIAAALDPASDPAAVADRLSRLAVSRGANDNVTLVIAALAPPFAPGVFSSKDLESCGSAGSD